MREINRLIKGIDLVGQELRVMPVENGYVIFVTNGGGFVGRQFVASNANELGQIMAALGEAIHHRRNAR